jgi:anti-sigma factor RsiW
MATGHISDEWLHEYSQADLEEPRMSKIEEHLLICDRCRHRVIAFDHYRKIDEPSERSLGDRKALHPN